MILVSETQYFWSEEKPEACKTIQQPVGILPPDWLHDAEFLGQVGIVDQGC